MNAPCGGCPPCCQDCVFDNANGRAVEASTQVVVVMPKADYGCVRPNGGNVVTVDGKLGMMRKENFHAVTDRGAAFLHSEKNPLAVHC